jgi:hypothetical protein
VLWSWWWWLCSGVEWRHPGARQSTPLPFPPSDDALYMHDWRREVSGGGREERNGGKEGRTLCRRKG